jgi:aryl-alcohol dehydrogenase-like predicted oxidoreductase
VEEVVRALDEAVRSGKVLYVGISDTPAWIVSQAVTLANLRGWSPFVGLQIPYGLIERSPERDLLPMAKALDLAVTTWGAVGQGLLTGRYGTDRPRPSDGRLATTMAYSSRSLTERNLRIADVVNQIAGERQATATQVAIAWVRAQQHRAVVLPVIGARTERQLTDNLAALDLDLTRDELERLDAVSRIELGFPHDFIGRSMAHGETFALVDDHRGLGYGELEPRPQIASEPPASDAPAA